MSRNGKKGELRQSHRVLVVGGGPAGLASAITLAAAGVAVVVVERHDVGPAAEQTARSAPRDHFGETGQVRCAAVDALGAGGTGAEADDLVENENDVQFGCDAAQRVEEGLVGQGQASAVESGSTMMAAI